MKSFGNGNYAFRLYCLFCSCIACLQDWEAMKFEFVYCVWVFSGTKLIWVFARTWSAFARCIKCSTVYFFPGKEKDSLITFSGFGKNVSTSGQGGVAATASMGSSRAAGFTPSSSRAAGSMPGSGDALSAHVSNISAEGMTRYNYYDYWGYIRNIFLLEAKNMVQTAL